MPLLEGHNQCAANIGTVENPRIEGTNLRADIRFGNSKRAQGLLRDVVDGVVRSLSVGCEWLTHVEAGRTVTRWRPLEVSVVSVPADDSAGFFRSRGNPMSSDENGHQATPDNASRNQRRNRDAAVELERVKEIYAKRDSIIAMLREQDPGALRDFEDLAAEAVEDRSLDHQALSHWCRNWSAARAKPMPSTPRIEIRDELPRTANSGALAAFGESRREQLETAHACGQRQAE